jgi:hypothetical protein
MTQSDKEEILWAAETIRTWEWRFEYNELLAVFCVLNELPQDKHPEAWADLREAFRNNEELNHPKVRELISFPMNVKGKNWWWDPDKWPCK